MNATLGTREQDNDDDSEQSQQTIIVVTGLKCAGKTRVTSEINNHGIPSYSMVEATGSERDLFRESDTVVVDGVHDWGTVAWLKETYGCHVPVVCVDAEFDARLDRYSGDQGSLIDRDERLLDTGLDTLLDRGQIVVYNGLETTEEQLESRVSDVVDVIQS